MDTSSSSIVRRVDQIQRTPGSARGLEAVLLTHPAVADAAVIPPLMTKPGEVPKGIIVLKEPIEPQALLDFVAERVAPHKRIRHLEFVDKIPKSPSGKILRRV